MIKGNYPSYYKDIDEVTSKLTIGMWHSALQDVNATTVFAIAQKYMLQSVFPPTIAQIREMVVKTINPDSLMSGEEAWETVILAIKKYGYYQQPEAFATFSEPIRRAVKAIGWQTICQSENIGYERAHFLKTFATFNELCREEALFPKQIFDKLQGMMNEKRLEKGVNEVPEV
jgi:hypothetical protein